MRLENKIVFFTAITTSNKEKYLKTIFEFNFYNIQNSKYEQNLGNLLQYFFL